MGDVVKNGFDRARTSSGEQERQMNVLILIRRSGNGLLWKKRRHNITAVYAADLCL
jgi:hypothetical protein